jgi:hypothetical protein
MPAAGGLCRGSNPIEMVFERGPVIRPEFQNSDSATLQVLLMVEVLVSDDQQLKSLGFGTIKEVAVADASPTHLDSRRHFMIGQRARDLNRNRFV